MKLLCVRTPTEYFFSDDKTNAPKPNKDLIVGEYYNSVNEKEFEDGVYYFLEEFEPTDCFHHSLFAKPSNLDETTLVNEEWEQKVCEPVNRKL